MQAREARERPDGAEADLDRGGVPKELLEAAQRTSGQGVTETVRQGLRLVAAGETFRRVAKLRGTVKFSVNLKKLRDDR